MFATLHFLGGKSALIFGGTGAAGQHLLQEFLQYSTLSRVGEYGRRVTAKERLTVGREKLVQKTIDFENLEAANLKEVKGGYIHNECISALFD